MFQCFPDGRFRTIQELEQYLKFDYLPHIVFETSSDKEDIQKRGFYKLKNNEVNQESQELGRKWIEKIDDAYIPRVSIRRLNETIGYGLFAEETLDEGCYVGEYTGVVRKNDRRYCEPLNNYCYEYPVSDNLERSFIIDAMKGNLTRFINHSFQPNLKPTYAFHSGFYHLIFLTIHPIQKGAQLFYNYGQNYWYVRKKPIDLSFEPKVIITSFL